MPENLEVHDSENIAFMDLGSEWVFYINIYRYREHGQVIRDIEFFMIFKNYTPYITYLHRLSSLAGLTFKIRERELGSGSSHPFIYKELNFRSFHIPVEIIDYLKINTYRALEIIAGKKTIVKEKICYGAIIKNPLRDLPEEFIQFSNLYQARNRTPLELEMYPELPENTFNQTMRSLKKLVPHEFVFAYLPPLYERDLPANLYLKCIKLKTIDLSRRSKLGLTYFKIDLLNQ